MRRAQKVRLRSRVRRRRGLFILKGVWALMLAAVLLTAARLGANRLSQMSFMPVEAFYISSQRAAKRGADPAMALTPANQDKVSPEPWQRFLLQDMNASLNGRSRFWVAWKGASWRRQILARFPQIASLEWDWLKLMLRGEIHARYRVREAAAFLALTGLFKDHRLNGHCLDREGFVFPCPIDRDIGGLVSVDEWQPSAASSFSIAFRALSYFEQTAQLDSPIKTMSFDDQRFIIYKDARGRLIRWHLQDLLTPALRERHFEKAAAVFMDLRSRGEDFRFIDFTLVSEGRVNVRG